MHSESSRIRLSWGATLAKVRTFGLALLKVKAPNSLAEWMQAMPEMTTAVPKAPGIPSTQCYRYKWVVRGFWDFTRQQAGGSSRHYLAGAPHVAKGKSKK